MFADVNSFLDVSRNDGRSFSLRNQLITICEVKADGEFLIHHFLSCFLKQNVPTCLVSFRQSYSHYTSVGNKIGSNLTAAKDNKLFTFIEGLKLLANSFRENGKEDESCKDCVSSGTSCIISIFVQLQSVIAKMCAYESSKPVLIIDSLSLLVDVGFSVKEVIALVHYLKSCMEAESLNSIVLCLNNDLLENGESSSLLRNFLRHNSTLNLEVTGLDSGYCRDVHGQLRATFTDIKSREKPLEKHTQFKLTDKTCSLFASGMSSAVL